MSNGINLLLDKKNGKNLASKVLFWYRVFSAFTVVMVLVGSFVLFSLKVVSPLGKLKQEQRVLLQNLSFIEKKRVKYDFLVDRIQNAKKILSLRTSESLLIDSIQKKLPQSVAISGIDISKKRVVFSISSLSLSEISTAIDQVVLVLQDNKSFRSITLDSMQIDTKSGKYSVSVRSELL